MTPYRMFQSGEVCSPTGWNKIKLSKYNAASLKSESAFSQNYFEKWGSYVFSCNICDIGLDDVNILYGCEECLLTVCDECKRCREDEHQPSQTPLAKAARDGSLFFGISAEARLTMQAGTLTGEVSGYSTCQ